MSDPVEIRAYDYVNHPFSDVKEAMSADPNQLFRSATMKAADRAASVAAGLHVNIAGIEFGKEIEIQIKGEEEIESNTLDRYGLLLSWQATKSANWFPIMDAVLSVYPISATETQLDFFGNYTPPLGVVGKVVNAMVGKKIAEASVHSFVAEVAQFLRAHATNA